MFPNVPAYQQLLIALFLSAISGIAGVYIQRLLSNRKPKIFLSSMGFQGATIEISDSLSDLTKKCPWGGSLEGFVEFADLLNFEQSIGTFAEELEKARSLVDSWVSKNNDCKNSPSMPKGVLLTCPYFHNPVIGSSYFGDLRRRTVLNVPFSDIDKLTALPSIFEIETENKEKIALHLGERGVAFPVAEEFGQHQIDSNRLLAYSFLKGHSENIFWVLENFLDRSSRDIIQLNKLRSEIQLLITENAGVVFTLQIANTGSEPQLIQPRGVIEIAYGENKLPIVVERREQEVKGNGILDEMLSAAKSKKKRSVVHVDTFLDKQDISPYLFVPGHSSEPYRFVSSETLGEPAKELINYYRLGGLKARAVLWYSSNKPVRSVSTLFNKTTRPEKRDLMIVTANKALKGD